jgi:hypothetical protein
MSSIEDIDALIAQGGRFSPFWGWHDNHRAADGTADYKPALMQVRDEFAALVDHIERLPNRERVLQLGMGNCHASHAAWRLLFDHAVTIDLGVVAVDDCLDSGLNTHDMEAQLLAAKHMPYDLLFIDAGHSYEDVLKDHVDYSIMVRPGGLIAFHDALPRAKYPEVEVWRYLRGFPCDRIFLAGEEVGLAWTKRLS